MSMSLESLMRETVLEPRDAVMGTQLVSFLLIGAGAITGFVVLSGVVLSLPLGLPNWVLSSLCYGFFVLAAYGAHRRLSFRSSASHVRALPIYVAVQVSGLGLATLFSWLAYGVLTLPTIVAAIGIICLTSGVNFVALKLWAFRNPAT